MRRYPQYFYLPYESIPERKPVHRKCRECNNSEPHNNYHSGNKSYLTCCFSHPINEIRDLSLLDAPPAWCCLLKEGDPNSGYQTEQDIQKWLKDHGFEKRQPWHIF